MSEKEDLKKIENKDLEEKVYEKLGTIDDPELGIDIVNLGLINEVNFYEEGLCEIKVTLTTMGCPFADKIQEDIRNVLNTIEEIDETEVKLVWYPAWTPERMSRYARIALGMS